MKVEVTEKQLKSLIKTGIREALSTELMKLRALLTSSVSVQEQYEVEKKHGVPRRESGSAVYSIKI